MAVEKRITIYTIAERLGISSTTVYRALNNKPRISEETKDAVFRVAEELGFKSNILAKGLARKPLRFAVIIMTGFSEFQNYILRGIKQTEKELYDFNVKVDYYIYEDEVFTEKAKRFRKSAFKKISEGGYNGVLSSTGEGDDFKPLAEKQIPVALIINEIDNSSRKFCIQHDSYTAGRMAGELLFWKLGKNAKVAVASGMKGFSVHETKVRGFQEQTKKTPLDIREVCYNRDSHEAAYRQTKEMIKKQPSIKGIYINSFNYSGVIEAVTDLGLAGKISIITSDISGKIKEYLAEGTVAATIFQNQYQQGQLGLRYLYRYVAENVVPEDMMAIKPEAVFISNINFYE